MAVARSSTRPDLVSTYHPWLLISAVIKRLSPSDDGRLKIQSAIVYSFLGQGTHKTSSSSSKSIEVNPVSAPAKSITTDSHCSGFH